MLFAGDAISAAEAERIGLINRVVPAARLDAEVNALVAKIAPTPLAVLRYTKLAILRAYDAMGLSQAVTENLDLSAILDAATTPSNGGSTRWVPATDKGGPSVARHGTDRSPHGERLALRHRRNEPGRLSALAFVYTNAAALVIAVPG